MIYIFNQIHKKLFHSYAILPCFKYEQSLLQSHIIQLSSCQAAYGEHYKTIYNVLFKLNIMERIIFPR